ncbi:MAG: complex I subunit 4 family protein [Methylococcaceae bacterium]
MPILSFILWLPLAFALLVAVVPSGRLRIIRSLTLTATGGVLLLILSLLGQFDTTSTQLQFSELVRWNPQLGSYYALGLDGVSLPMLLLSGVLCGLAALVSNTIPHHVKGYHIALLILEFGLLGVFMAQDWALFYVFWEATLIPLFFLIDRWGGQARHTASLNFVLYTMGGSVFMLIALLVIFTQSSEHSTAMHSMLKTAQALPRETQFWVLLGLCLGFGVKMPVFPLHGWLPLVHVEAPGPVSILLSGVLLKMGAYGLLRAIGMLPDAALLFQPWLAGLAVIGMVYGALLAFRQTDLKAMVAYSSVSHMGSVLLGIASLNQTGLLGATLQMTAHGLVAAALFLLVGVLYERTHTRLMADYGGLVQVVPRFALLTTLAWLGAMSLPGTAGFVAEVHVLLGSLQAFGGLTIAAVLALLVASAYAMRTTGRLLTGPLPPGMQTLPDLSRRELLAAGVLVGGIVWLGLMPQPLIQLMNASVTELGALFAYRNL